MDRHALDLLVADAKQRGDYWWEYVKRNNSHSPLEQQFATFESICETRYGEEAQTDKVANLQLFEMFLRAGKRMPPAVKIDNRKKADQLREEILRGT